MTQKKEFKIMKHFDNDGKTIQEVVEKYFSVYFQSELEKMENYYNE